MHSIPPLIKIVLAHSYPVYCAGFKLLFNRAKGIAKPTIVSVPALLADVLKEKPYHVLVIQETYKPLPPEKMITDLHKDFPEMKILVLTSLTDEIYISKLRENGASDFVHNSTDGREIKTGLFTVMKGMNYCCTTITSARYIWKSRQVENTNPAVHLCPREKEMLTCLLKRMTTAEMIEYFGVTEITIREYRSNTKRKIREAGYKDVFDYAEKNGIKY
jgi:two-component system invasion response regulator UvrY